MPALWFLDVINCLNLPPSKARNWFCVSERSDRKTLRKTRFELLLPAPKKDIPSQQLGVFFFASKPQAWYIIML